MNTNRQIAKWLAATSLVVLISGCSSVCRYPVMELQRLQAGDCLQIIFTNASSQEFREVINPEGDVSLPLFGKLHVAGLTLGEVRHELETAGAPFTRRTVAVSKCP
ncbi:MAG: Polysaccharide biosynthesis/export protein [Verrucomicrobiales bacterium]|nr:Polysaccharide biosynthesis/export protein [Verrucomicrobiales bacterium]